MVSSTKIALGVEVAVSVSHLPPLCAAVDQTAESPQRHLARLAGMVVSVAVEVWVAEARSDRERMVGTGDSVEAAARGKKEVVAPECLAAMVGMVAWVALAAGVAGEGAAAALVALVQQPEITVLVVKEALGVALVKLVVSLIAAEREPGWGGPSSI